MTPTCSHCGALVRRANARFCTKCGTRLAVVQIQQPRSGWKSVPAVIRLAIWIIAIPIVTGLAIWVTTWGVLIMTAVSAH